MSLITPQGLNLDRPDELGNLVEVARWYAENQPDDFAFTFLVDGEREEANLTFAALDARAQQIAAYLQRADALGDRALLVYEPGLDYLAALFGCLYAGVVAVPIYPPDPFRLQRTLPRLKGVVEDSQARFVLSTAATLGLAEPLFLQAGTLCRESLLATDTLPEETGCWDMPELRHDTLAVLQYTSGSTGTPKGVMLSHGNLLHNLSQLHRIDPSGNMGVCWLPPYHDMGLIGAVLLPFFRGKRSVLMSPLAFVQRPLRWLDAISRYRATSTGGPNFAYELCLKKITAEERRGLDLSCWKLACNGAEPVRAATLQKFSETFADCGFRPETFYPCYGLAEATLIVSGGQRGRRPVVRRFSAAALEQGIVAPPGPDSAGNRPLVSNGQAVPDHDLLIVNPHTRQRCASDQVGEIWVKGPGVAQGYWGRSEESAEVFRATLADEELGPYLRTGDLGFIADGELFIAGRLKDLIVVAGKNFYPHDIEQTVERCDAALKADGGAAFSIDLDGQERLVIVHEALRPNKLDLEALAQSVRLAIVEEHGIEPQAIVFIKAGTLPKTTSGKIQRRACRQAFLDGQLSALKQWTQADASNSEPAVAAAAMTPTTELLATLYEDVLGIRGVGAGDHFFELGGHSLLATQLVARVRSVLDVELPLRALFEAPVVRDLAARIDELRQSGSGPAAPPLTAIERSGELALSFAQQRLWFLDQLEPGNPFYNVPAAAELSGPLDLSALEQALHYVVARHEALRTRLVSDDGRPLQVIDPAESLELSLPVNDLSGLADDQQQAAVAQAARDASRQPFDLARGPLWRAQLLRLSEQRHVLVLVMHHIVSDGWSMGVLLEEWGAAYAQLVQGAGPQLEPLTIQYADYAAWQRSWLSGATLDEQLAYWKQQLGSGTGCVAPLELPGDYPRPAQPTFAGARQRIEFSPELSARLAELCRREGVTLYMALLAGLDALLSRWTGQTDIAVGSPLANRRQVELERLIGFFVNTLVMRTDASGDPTYRELLSRVREVTLGAYAHQDVPFEKLVEALAPERSRNRSALFQVALVVQNAPLDLTSGPLAVRPLDVDNGTSKYDQSWFFWQEDERLVGWLEYSTELFAAETIGSLVEALTALLTAAVADPGQTISRLPLMSPERRRQVLVDWNATERPLPAETTLAALFASQAARTPTAVAVECGGERLTYAELDARANQLAHHLQALGVGPEARVGLCLERGVDLLAAVLAVLKSGGAYVPLDPAYPRKRLEAMLADADLGALVSSQAVWQSLQLETELSPRQCVWLDDASAPWSACPTTAPPCQATGDDLAYVIYTSGSTGQPKGVEVTQRGVVNFLQSFARTPGLESRHTLVAVTTLSFDIAVLELLLPVTVGAQVVIATREVASDGRLLSALLEQTAATHLQATPATWRMLLMTGWQPAPSLTMLCGGEAMDRGLADALLHNGAALWNVYGPTETTVWSTAVQVLPATGPVLIGYPIDNTQVYILDARREPLAPGMAGELYIGGAGVARGYRNRPDLTADKFVPDPFATDFGARLYRTGDLARWLPDGQLEFFGRADDQLKIRGFRIEPGDIRAAIVSHPRIADAVVIAREDVPGDKRLVAYFVAQGAAPATAELRSLVAGTLPDYMVPSAFVALDKLPRLPNGKLDRRALPAPELAGDSDADSSTASPTAEIVAGMMAQVLGVRGVGAGDHFFELGGHSLLATQLVARVRSVLDVELPLRALFEAPVVRDLAAKIDALRQSGSGPAAPPLTAIERSGELALSFAQQRLWFLDQLEPGNPFYNVPAAAELSGPLDRSALEQALLCVVARHEALRTRLVSDEGRPLQVIDPAESLDLSLPVCDLSGLADDQQQAAVAQAARDASRQPFDLARGPLWRAQLLKLSEERHVLVLVMHHIVSDGWSMGVLLEEWGAAYARLVQGERPQLEPLTIQYADYAAWQRSWLSGTTLDEQLAYWKQQLGSGAGCVAPLELPGDYPRPAQPTFAGARQRIEFSPELSARLAELCRREGVTLYMALLAGLDALLSRWTGQTDIAVGSPLANRRQVELERLIGFFVNTLVMRTDASGDPTYRELLSRVREVTLGAYAHQDVPFEKLVEALAPERSRNRSALFQVALVVQNAPLDLTSGPLAVRPLDVDNGTSKYDQSWFFWQENERLVGWLEYSTELFAAETIGSLVEALTALLTAAVADPGQTISRLPLMSPERRRQVLVDWNATERPLPAETTLAALFASQAARTPTAVAVECGGERLTYAELDARANQLAHHLQALGVGPEARVGLCLERGVDLLAAVLAVLKSGGAYVPLDPAYPRKRLEAMLADADLGALVSSQAVWQSLQLETELSPRQCVWLDDASAPWSACPTTAPPCQATGDDLAYVIYTSGSTGQPKGVEVTQRGVVNHALALAQAYRQPVGGRMLQYISLSFDAAGEEIYPAWASGMTLVVPPSRGVLAGRELLDLCRQERISVLHLPTAVWHQCVDEAANVKPLPELRVTLVGGESPQPEKLSAWRAWTGACVRFLHAYGITEATITSTLLEIDESTPLDEPPARLPIGRPLSNVRVYVLDSQLEPTAPGMPGELCVSGVGVARGYHGLSAATVEKFLSNPFGAAAGERLYRSGDRARWLPSGQLEFLGRMDEQIKIRGFRIEPGEIETVLQQHPAVLDAQVMVREDAPGRRQLVAYAVAKECVDETPAAGASEHVQQWQRLFDETYERADRPSDPTFNITGWNSSYTGKPIAAEEMRRWVDHTVSRILATKPRDVLEMGCGTGLLLFRVAPHVNSYTGCDFSAASLAYIQRCLFQPEHHLPQVALAERTADQWEGIAPASLDTVVLNSVVQYFPSVDYLVSVLRQAVKAVRPGGAVFLGDLRNLAILGAFHTSVELAAAADDLPRAALLARVQSRLEREQELAVDPRLFAALQQEIPQITAVRTLVKRGRDQNELTRFRYDVLLQIGHALPQATMETYAWGDEAASVEDIRQRLQGAIARNGKYSRGVCIRGVVNPRVAADAAAWRLLTEPNALATAGDLRQQTAVQAVGGIEPEELYELADECGFELDLSWQTADNAGSYDAVFLRRGKAGLDPAEAAKRNSAAASQGVAENGESVAWARYGNHPLKGRQADRLLPTLRNYLRDRLPHYLTPDHLLLVDRWPLTVHGKIDRGALPAPNVNRSAWGVVSVPPRTETETKLAGLWAELLGLEQVGATDNFFDLGGHSMLAVQMTARIEEMFGRRLPLATFFQEATIEALARRIDRATEPSEGNCLVAIQPRGERPPLFCVHPAGGTVFCYRDLARHLGADQPLYGLQARGLDGETTPHQNFAAMAAEYIAAMREVQPQGPYLLAGWSLGGNLAYEMALQLTEQGESIALLALLDAGTMPRDRRLSEDDFLPLLQELFPEEVQLDLGQLRSLSQGDQLKFFVERASQAQLIGAELPTGQLPQVFDVFQATIRGMIDWQARPLPGHVTLLRAAQQETSFTSDATLGWGALASQGVTVRHIDCDHIHMLREPAVAQVAKTLGAAIDAVLSAAK